MRRTRQITCLALALAAALPLAACGGDDDKKSGKSQLANEGDRSGAEAAVRDYLRALVDKDGSAACAKLTPEYQKSVLEQNAAFVRKRGVDSCPAFIDSVTRVSKSVTFEGKPLNAQSVGKLKLVASVRAGGEEQNATVTGPAGVQRYELHTTDGKWLIAEIANDAG